MPRLQLFLTSVGLLALKWSVRVGRFRTGKVRWHVGSETGGERAMTHRRSCVPGVHRLNPVAAARCQYRALPVESSSRVLYPRTPSLRLNLEPETHTPVHVEDLLNRGDLVVPRHGGSPLEAPSPLLVEHLS